MSTYTSGKVSTYYIAADVLSWNYVPSGKNLITGKPFNKDTSIYTVNAPNRIDPIYIKALYREYTYNRFTCLSPYYHDGNILEC